MLPKLLMQIVGNRQMLPKQREKQIRIRFILLSVVILAETKTAGAIIVEPLAR